MHGDCDADLEASGRSCTLSPGSILNGRYKLCDQLGEGQLGVVHKAERLSDGALVAIKSSWHEWEFEGEKWLVEKGLAGSTIFPRIDEVFRASVNCQETSWHCLVMELCGATVEASWEDYRENVHRCRAMVQALLEGLMALHAQQGIHCDLKPSNICEARPPAIGWRVIDWGLMWQEPTGTAPCGRGTWGYQSPEMLTGNEFDARTDIWALGVMLAERYLGEPWGPGSYQLFHEADEFSSAGDIIEQIQSTMGAFPGRVDTGRCYEGNAEHFFSKFPTLLSDFLRQMLELDSLVRPTAAAMLGHIWITIGRFSDDGVTNIDQWLQAEVEVGDRGPCLSPSGDRVASASRGAAIAAIAAAGDLKCAERWVIEMAKQKLL